VACYAGGLLPSPEEAEVLLDCAVFDHILAREPWRRKGSRQRESRGEFALFAERARALLAPGGDLSLLQSPPRLGERISRLLQGSPQGQTGEGPDLTAQLVEAEEAFFASPGPWDWTAEDLAGAFREGGLETDCRVIDQKEERLLTDQDLARWFDPGRSAWGDFIRERLGEEVFARLSRLLTERIREGPVVWQWQQVLLRGRKRG